MRETSLVNNRMGLRQPVAQLDLTNGDDVGRKEKMSTDA